MKIKIIWPILFIAAILVACILIYPSDPRLADLLNRAGKNDAAIAQYEEILRLDPLRTSARVELSRLYLRNGQPDKAVQELEKVGAEVIDDEFFLQQIADIYSELGDKDKTVSVLERIVTLNPASGNKRKLADAYDWNLQREEAKQVYLELLAENPNDPDVLNKVVRINLAQNRFQETVPYLIRLIDIQPAKSELRLLLADVYIELKQKQLAAKELELVLAAEPGNHSIRQRLAELYLWQDDYERGLKHYTYLANTHPSNRLYTDRYTDLAYNLAPEQAINFYKQRLQQDPHDTEMREKLVGLYLHVGDADHAVHQTRILVAKNPAESKYYKQLAYLYQDMRQPHLANPVFEFMFKKSLEDREVIDELQTYYYENKEFSKLLDLYLELYDRDKMDEELVAEHAELLLRTGNYADARQQYVKLLEQAPENPYYRLQLADLHTADGRSDKAVRLLLAGLNRDDMRDIDYLEYTAEFLDKNNLPDKSTLAYEKLVTLAPKNLYYKKQLVAKYITARNFDQATLLHRQILAERPHDIEVRLELADLYWHQDNLEKMHNVIESVDRAYRDDLETGKLVAGFYFDRGFYNKTTVYAKRLMSASATDSTALRMLGLAYAWNNQSEEAMTVLSRYHELYPNDYYTRFTLGELYILGGDHRQALNELEISLGLIMAERRTKETRATRGKILAFQNKPGESRAEFTSLIADYPKDADVYIDFAESRLHLKDYDGADALLEQALTLQPQNYRALRLSSRSRFDQGEYTLAATILRDLIGKYPDDMGLRIDLADSEWADSDWYESSQNLEHILGRYPKNLPAKKRLAFQRRSNNESVSAEYRMETQGDNFLRQLYNVVVSKAKSSLLHLKALFGEETFSTKDNSLPETRYVNAGITLSSRFNRRLQTNLSAKGQQNGDNWYLTGMAGTKWHFNNVNSIGVQGEVNTLWHDPLAAALQQGRSNRLMSNLNLSLKRLYLWNRFVYEHHKLASKRYGDAMRSYLQVGYRWGNKLDFSTYYQLYHLAYKYSPQADQALVSIPEKDMVHYLGAHLSQQLTGNFYYELGGSLGYNTVQNSATYFGTASLEYTLVNRFRLRSLLEYGSQNQLGGNDKSTSFMFDFSFFY